MPASRSRTERWRECLDQVYERSGGLEISLDRAEHAAGTAPAHGAVRGDLIWRVRILQLSETEIVVEQPSALGQTIPIQAGTRLVVGITIGQNRWMFRTDALGGVQLNASYGRPTAALRLAMPDHVERCQRRNFYRMSTTELRLPEVRCWPLLDPATAVAGEVANRALIQDLIDQQRVDRAAVTEEPLVLPEVGPSFMARLVNIGGGGAGLLIERGAGSGADRTRTLWVRLDLRPQIPAPIAMTAKIAHTHIDSAQNVYLGLAFDFTFHASHREFVAGQISRYVLTHQREQHALRAAG